MKKLGWLGSARLGSARIGLARIGSARRPLQTIFHAFNGIFNALPIGMALTIAAGVWSNQWFSNRIRFFQDALFEDGLRFLKEVAFSY